MGNPKLGDDVSEAQLYPLLANRYYFGVNLFEIVAQARPVVRMFGEMNRGPARCPRDAAEVLRRGAGAGVDFLLITEKNHGFR